MIMTKITAAEVNKLRKATGAGMMDCKKALVEAEGDFDKAIEILRKKGQKVAANRADRESTEGAAIAKVNGDSTKGVSIVLGCETDFWKPSQNDSCYYVIKFGTKKKDLCLFYVTVLVSTCLWSFLLTVSEYCSPVWKSAAHLSLMHFLFPYLQCCILYSLTFNVVFCTPLPLMLHFVLLYF